MSDQSERWPLSGDPDGRRLADLYRRHATWLARRFRRRWGEEADDIAQDAWMRFARYEPASVTAPRALLARIGRNLELDRLRRAAREPPGGLEPPRSETGDQFERVVLREVIATMPVPLRDVFVLSRFAGLAHRDIGARLGISEKTVEWRLSRALMHCARQMEVRRDR